MQRAVYGHRQGVPRVSTATTSMETTASNPYPIVEKLLRTLQLNINKRREVQWSLLNNEYTNTFDFLFLSEPHVFLLYHTNQPEIISHPNWVAYQPSQSQQNRHVRYSYRAAIMAYTRLDAKALPVPSSDIIAIEIKIDNRVLLLLSIYIPTSRLIPEAEQELLNVIYYL